MQRVPSNSYPLRSAGADGSKNGVQTIVNARQANDQTPLMQLARRIRDEQGVEGLRGFLCAMAPYSAPNEIRRTGESFGLSYDNIMKPDESGGKPGIRPVTQENADPQPKPQPMDALQTVMLLQNLLNRGGGAGSGFDMSSVLRALNNMERKN